MLVQPESCLVQPPAGNGSSGGDGFLWGLWRVTDPLPLVRRGLGHPSVSDGACHSTLPYPATICNPQLWGFEPQTSLLLVGDGKELLLVGEP